MSLLEEIIKRGFKIEGYLRVGADTFKIYSDGMNYEICYAALYGDLPSSVTFTLKSDRFWILLDYLTSVGLSITTLKETRSRRRTDTVTLVNHQYKILIEVSKTSLVGDDDGDDGDDDDYVGRVNSDGDSDNIDISIFYSGCDADSRGVVAEIDKMFSVPKDLSDAGSILVFESQGPGSMELVPHKIAKTTLDIGVHYNDDFPPVDTKVQQWMVDFSTKNNKLVLLHGEPGTGKTNYIRHLLASVKDAKTIYIPPCFVQSIADPAFIPIIRREKRAVLIIEDAEKILVDRQEDSDNNAISVLLNLSDGIMGDILDFKIIATFNSDVSSIDSALTRRGRMFLKYHFSKLSPLKTRVLYNQLYNTDPPVPSMTLADIYNEDNSFGTIVQKPKVGFLP